jgi:hypothetical protein
VLGSVLGALLAACAPTSAAAPPQLHPRLASTTDVGAHAATKGLRATAERGSAMAARDAEVEPGAAGARGTWAGSYRDGLSRYGSALVVELDEHAPGALHGTASWSVPPRDDGFSTGTRTRRVLPGHVRVTVPLVRVAAEGERVVLVTARYFDPACACTAQGTLTGTLRGDTLVGRLTVRGAATTAERRGTWRMVRVPPPSAALRAAESPRR